MATVNKWGTVHRTFSDNILDVISLGTDDDVVLDGQHLLWNLDVAPTANLSIKLMRFDQTERSHMFELDKPIMMLKISCDLSSRQNVVTIKDSDGTTLDTITAVDYSTNPGYFIYKLNANLQWVKA